MKTARSNCLDYRVLRHLGSPIKRDNHTSAETCEKGSWCLRKEICVNNLEIRVRKSGSTCASPTAMI